MPLLLSGRGFRRELESAGCMAVFAPSRVVLKRVCCADCAELGIARSFPLPAVWAIQRCFYSKTWHSSAPPRHQSVGRGAAVGEVQEVMPLLGEAMLGTKPVALWLLEGQVLSRSELSALCDLCRREPRLKVVVEMGGARSLRWQPMNELLNN